MPAAGSPGSAPNQPHPDEQPLGPAACFACGHRGSSFWLRHTGYDIRRCDECRLGGVFPIPDEATLATVYDASYIAEGGAFGYQDRADDLAAQKTKQIRDRRALLRSLGYSPGRALDLGCGDGWWLEGLSVDHEDVVGVEPMAEVRATAAARLGSVRLLADLTGLADEERFDLITAFDVLEHLPDPWSVLEVLVSRLRPGGFLCVVVPIADHWTARFRPAEWDQIKPPEHLWYFTRKALRRVTARLDLDLRVEASAWSRWPRPLPGVPQVLQAPFRFPMKLLARISSTVDRGIADSLLCCAQKRGP